MVRLLFNLALEDIQMGRGVRGGVYATVLGEKAEEN